ncbi:hypothetical protein EWM64_g3149 [Hericium alpestre]|uniref:Uncharacterized protein n=1 Tax=Hericium alpestre TaxID=135208 RepID=A0A4Z0A3G8_9AGAM|nr:hypothetical protein EWM64_g3149 [Hericium alpestre]
MHRVHSLLLSANHSGSNSSTVAFMGVVETLIGLVEEMETPGLHTLVLNVSKGLRSSLIGLPLKMDRIPSVRRLALSEGIYTPFVSTPLALRHLRLGGFCLDGVHMRWLLKAAPHLRSLELGGGFMELYETTNVRTSVLRELTHLRLRSMYYVWDLVTLLCWMPHVQALHVEQGFAGRVNARSPQEGDDVWHVIPTFHHLREAHLVWTSSIPQLLHLLHRTPNLETLSLQLPLGASPARENASSDVPAVPLDKLAYLRVSGRARDVKLLLSAILLPKTAQLDLRIRDDSPRFAECMHFADALSARFLDIAAEGQDGDTEDNFYHIRLACAHKTGQLTVARECASPPCEASLGSTNTFDSSSFVLWFMRVRSLDRDEAKLHREALILAEPRPLFPTPDDFTALADAAWSRPWHNFLSEPQALHISTLLQSRFGAGNDVWPAADPGMVADVWQPLLAQLSQATHLTLSGAAVRGVLEALIVGESEAQLRGALEGSKNPLLPLLSKLTVSGSRDMRPHVDVLVKQLCYSRVEQGNGLRCFEFAGA